MAPWPVANAISTLAIGALGLVVPIEAAGKLFLSLCVVTWLAGAWRLLRGGPFALVALPFAINYSIWHGQINFALGAGLLLLALAELRRDRVGGWALAVLAVLLALSHGAAYAMLWIAAGVLWLGRPRPGSAARLALALAPSLVLLLPYALSRVGAGNTTLDFGPSVGYWLRGKPGAIPGYLAPFHGFYPFLDVDLGLLRAAAAVNVVLTVALVLLCCLVVWSAARVRREPAQLAVIAVFGVCYAISPIAVGDFNSPAERFIYPTLLLCLALGWSGTIWLPRLINSAVVLVLLAQTAFWHVHVGGVAGEMERLYGQMREADLGQRFEPLREDTFDLAGPRERPFYLPVHESLFRLPYYLAIERGSYIPVFWTGMFRALDPDPDRSTPAAVIGMRSPPDSFVVLGRSDGNDAIAKLLAPAYRVTLREPRMLVLRRA